MTVPATKTKSIRWLSYSYGVMVFAAP